jgi:hypothetical protein
MTNWNNNDTPYNLVWTNSANGGLFYTSTAFKIKAKEGTIISPNLSATNITASKITATNINASKITAAGLTANNTITASAIHLTANGDVHGDQDGTPMLRIGPFTSYHMEIDGNEIVSKAANVHDALNDMAINIADSKTGKISMGYVTAASLCATNVVSSNKTITAITTTASIGSNTGVLYLL